MSKRLFFLFVSAALILSALPVTIGAQDEEWTCDDGTNDVLIAAQEAFDNDDRDTAWALAARAEALCVSNADRFRDAQRLRRRLDPNIRDRLADADPGVVDLGDYKLLMICKGEGSPTIIFENGLGVNSFSSWDDVLPVVSTVTRACQYDRVGLLQSLPADLVRTTQDQVDDLVALLEIAEIESPYLLVGHSFGGINVSLIIDQYPDRVEGVVLVDASHPDQDERHAEANPEFEAPPVGEPVSQERLDITTSLAQAAGVQDFGDRPLAVVTAGIGSGEDPIWVELQNEYAAYSTNSLHIIAEHSNHMIMRSEPQVIIEAILWTLEEVWAAERSE